MPQIINTNVMSLNAQRNLNQTQNSLKTSLERLSSGLRINSAKDDAAGLAIADRMTTQIRGMNQAIRNANDAISLAQTGEGALKQVTSNLQRMRELAVQSANVTNTDSDRQSLNAEFQELLAENDRLAQTTSFNGKKVLDGSMGNAQFQVGANVGETISIDVSTSMRTSEIGGYASKEYSLASSAAIGGDATVADANALDANDELIINGTAITAVTGGSNGTGAGSAIAVAEAINNEQANTGVTASAGPASVTIGASDINSFAMSESAVTTDVDDSTYTLTINGTAIFTQDAATGTDTAKTVQELTSAINTFSDTTGVVARAQDDGSMTLTAADGRNIEITEAVDVDNAGDSVTGYFGNTAVTADTTYYGVTKGAVTLESDAEIVVDFVDPSTDTADALFGLTADDTISMQNLNASDILTVSNSELSMKRIDQAISDVDVFRGTFGALQSRFESTVASLQTTVENVSAARSRIQDADFAAETAELTRTQILQQAGTAMLAQANSAPQGVLALLQ